MVERLNAGLCWKSFQYNNPNHVNNLNDEGFTFLRVYINLADFPQATPDQAYIKSIMEKQDGMWCWDDFSKRWWSGPVNDKVRNSFDYCKANNKLAIVCFGHNEEQNSWLTRSPGDDKLAWLTLMATEFAEYLKINYNFTRVDMESWNEPNECMSPDIYSKVTIALSKGWRSIYPNSLIHSCGVNLVHQPYIDACLSIPAFVLAVNCISPHILSDAEWNATLISNTYKKALAKGLRVTYLEISPLGDLNRLHLLIGYCSMYAVVLWIRNSLIGQNDGIIITDALIYSFDTPNAFESINKNAMDFITQFNKDHTVGVDMSIPVVTGDTYLTKNFQYKEFFCNGKQPPDIYYPNILALAQELQKLRDKFACKIFIESGWRDAVTNQAVGGKVNSQHLTGKAADIIVEKFPAHVVGYYAARFTKCNGIGYGKKTTTHLDIRPIWTPYQYV